MACRLVVFDCFGVISSEVAPKWLREHFDEKTAREIKSGLIADVDKGLIGEAEMLEKLEHLSGEPAKKILEDWLGFAVVDGKTVEYIKSLRRTHKTALLSNSSSEFIRRIFTPDDFREMFDIAVISADVGYAKPSEEIFRMVLEKAEMDACDAIMIDDNAENLKAAASIGMQTFLFKDSSSLTELTRLIRSNS